MKNDYLIFSILFFLLIVQGCPGWMFALMLGYNAYIAINRSITGNYVK
jgi:hypothetical protein